MGFYQSPAHMYESRAARFKRDADRHWAMAKSGGNLAHFTKARFCYEQAAANRAKAAQSRAVNAAFGKR